MRQLALLGGSAYRARMQISAAAAATAARGLSGQSEARDRHQDMRTGPASLAKDHEERVACTANNRLLCRQKGVYPVRSRKKNWR